MIQCDGKALYCVCCSSHRRTDGLLPVLILTYTVERMAPWVTQYTQKQPTWIYLNTKLHCHPVNILSVLSTLAHRARAICNQHSLQTELNTLQFTLPNNRRSKKIQCILYPPQKIRPPRDGRTTITYPAVLQSTSTASAECYQKIRSWLFACQLG